MAHALIINPKRKRRAHKRRRHVMRTNPVKRRRPARKRHVMASRRHHGLRHRIGRARRRISSGKSFMSASGFMKNMLMPSAIGAGGALGLDILLGYLPLPAAVATGPMRPLVRLVGAAALGLIASKITGKAVGEKVAAGAVTVVLYSTFKGFLQTAMPSLPGLAGNDYGTIGYMNAGQYMGEYVGSNSVAMPMGEYVGM